MRIKNFIKNCLPFIIESRRLSQNVFIDGYLNWKCNGQNFQLDENNLFESVVSIQGFGYSGSGAVVDLLREHEECYVYGSIDDESNTKSTINRYGEFDLLRFSGGVFELEKYIGSKNIFINAEALNRFTIFISQFPLFKNFMEFRPIFYSFFDAISDFHVSCEKPVYNRYLHKFYGKKSYVFFLKNISVIEYRNISRTFLNSIFNQFAGQGNKIFVADQICTDFEFDTNRYQDYIPNLKTIIVYRDPRDVYEYAKRKGVQWIPHNNPDAFVKWLSYLTSNFDINSQNSLVIKFENLVRNYYSETKKIEEYLHLSENKYKFKYFNPDISIKNMGIWRDDNQDEEEYSLIRNNFTDFCS